MPQSLALAAQMVIAKGQRPLIERLYAGLTT
jgi:hypothetical protein